MRANDQSFGPCRGERLNTLTHLLGLAMAIASAPLLLAQALASAGIGRTVGALVFSISCIGLYSASTLFHAMRGRSKAGWERLDHCAIFALIAGTFTPFVLLLTEGALQWALLCAVWGVAVGGAWHVLCRPSRTAPLALYVGMGWAAAAGASWLASQADARVVAWLLAGVLWYSGGTVFFVNRQGYRHAHGVWHLFVLAGSASHHAAIFLLMA